MVAACVCVLHCDVRVCCVRGDVRARVGVCGVCMFACLVVCELCVRLSGGMSAVDCVCICMHASA